MTKEEYADNAIRLPTKCKAFAKETRKQWRTEVPDDPTDWESLDEVSDVYLTLETLEAKADLLSQRAMTLRQFWLRVGA